MQLVLDNLRSMHNVGSIFRTADAVGVEKIYLCGITPAPLDRFNRKNKKLLKVSLGAEKSVAWEKIGRTSSLLKRLKGQGLRIIALEQDIAAHSFINLKPTSAQLKNSILVLGSEVKGLPRSILNLADKIIEIPMFGKKESLNVAVAFGIVAYHLSLAAKKNNSIN